ncbi:hypothetical protein Fmac_012834 [Flemingia macrophylla]|uniref:Uncharacterized protein n=1 Tax=Flemingia macrophylla TaxID=520843 RepID=A0ABD1MS97_9FABA
MRTRHHQHREARATRRRPPHFGLGGEGRPGMMVVESLLVDVSEGSIKDDTYYFMQGFISFNLISLVTADCSYGLESSIFRDDHGEPGLICIITITVDSQN